MRAAVTQITPKFKQPLKLFNQLLPFTKTSLHNQDKHRAIMAFYDNFIKQRSVCRGTVHPTTPFYKDFVIQSEETRDNALFLVDSL